MSHDSHDLIELYDSCDLQSTDKVFATTGSLWIFGPDLPNQGGNPRQALDATVDVVGMQNDER